MDTTSFIFTVFDAGQLSSAGRRRVVLCGRVLTLTAQREFIDLVVSILERSGKLHGGTALPGHSCASPAC